MYVFSLLESDNKFIPFTDIIESATVVEGSLSIETFSKSASNNKLTFPFILKELAFKLLMLLLIRFIVPEFTFTSLNKLFVSVARTCNVWLFTSKEPLISAPLTKAKPLSETLVVPRPETVLFNVPDRFNIPELFIVPDKLLEFAFTVPLFTKFPILAPTVKFPEESTFTS